MEQAADTSIEDAVYQRALRLLTVQHAVAEIAGGRKVDADPEALSDAVFQVRQAVRRVQGAYACFIGGLAVQQRGYNRWTDDVDVVVDAEHYGAVLDELRAAGFAITKDFNLRNRDTGVEIDLLKEGITMKDARFPLPHPSELGPNTGHVRLSWLIRLKLDAHRRQDLADVVRIMYSHLGETEAICSELPEVFRKEFLELAAEARHEVGE
jgi:hypothetical protein